MLFSTLTAIAFTFTPVISNPKDFYNQDSNLLNLNSELAINSVKFEPVQTKKMICLNCSKNETDTLEFLLSRGIQDVNALATIMGNIKQESGFVSNICEGGSRTRYEHCGAGYGIIQFTDSTRYYGLGSYARKTNGDPSSLLTQLNYMMTEPQWKQIENRMMVPGKSISQYMTYAYSWIGWGIHGARTSFAHDYSKRLIMVNS